MRRAASLILALALVGAGAYWAIHIWLYAERLYAKVLLAPLFMIVTGCIWLYNDYFDATTRKRP